MGKYKPPTPLKKRALLKILRAHGCVILPKRGKGSHWCVTRALPDGSEASYTLADHREYECDYINPPRRALGLSDAEGVSTRDFLEV